MLLPVFFLLRVAVFAEEFKVFLMPSSAFTAMVWPVEYENLTVSQTWRWWCIQVRYTCLY